MKLRHVELGIFWKEWRARRWVLAGLGGVMALLAAGLIGRPRFYPDPLVIVLLLSAVILGVGLFTREEHDPARGLIYQLPISRRRLLAVKLGALACQIGALALMFAVAFLILIIYSSNFSRDTDSIFPLYAWGLPLTLYAAFVPIAAGLALGLMAAIVALHARTVVLSVVLTLVFGCVVGFLIAMPFKINTQLAQQSTDALFAGIGSALGWLFFRVGVTTAVLGGWVFFLFCRTRIQELGATTRTLLVFLWAAGLIEILATIFFTGWRDLAYLLFGI